MCCGDELEVVGFKDGSVAGGVWRYVGSVRVGMFG